MCVLVRDIYLQEGVHGGDGDVVEFAERAVPARLLL
jgi:hypothetical protein